MRAGRRVSLPAARIRSRPPGRPSAAAAGSRTGTQQGCCPARGQGGELISGPPGGGGVCGAACRAGSGARAPRPGPAGETGNGTSPRMPGSRGGCSPGIPPQDAPVRHQRHDSPPRARGSARSVARELPGLNEPDKRIRCILCFTCSQPGALRRRSAGRRRDAPGARTAPGTADGARRGCGSGPTGQDDVGWVGRLAGGFVSDPVEGCERLAC